MRVKNFLKAGLRSIAGIVLDFNPSKPGTRLPFNSANVPENISDNYWTETQHRCYYIKAGETRRTASIKGGLGIAA